MYSCVPFAIPDVEKGVAHPGKAVRHIRNHSLRNLRTNSCKIKKQRAKMLVKGVVQSLSVLSIEKD